MNASLTRIIILIGYNLAFNHGCQGMPGFMSWPFDKGNNETSGVTGLFASLPELFFLKIRKGSYKYLSYNQLMNVRK